jgi:hypothetical protein
MNFLRCIGLLGVKTVRLGVAQSLPFCGDGFGKERVFALKNDAG